MNIDKDNGNKNADIKCEILFEESAKIEYYFRENHNQFKMYPIKIRTFKKLPNHNNEFTLYNEMEYTKFDYSFDNNFNRISSNLPGKSISFNN